MSKQPTASAKRGRGRPRSTGVRLTIRIAREDGEWWSRYLVESGYTATGLFRRLRDAYEREQTPPRC